MACDWQGTGTQVVYQAPMTSPISVFRTFKAVSSLLSANFGVNT